MNNVCRLNNRKLRAIRKDIVYEAIMTDLCLIGALDREVVEDLLGHSLSEHLTNPLSEKTIQGLENEHIYEL